MGTTGSGPLCLTILDLTPKLCELETRPRSNGHGCFHCDLDGAEGICQPPWNLVGRVLAQAQQQRATLILVAPVWRTQTWYPVLLEMCIDLPRIMPNEENLILPTHPQSMLEVIPQLAVWSISGDDTKPKSFRKKLSDSCSHRGGKNPRSHMSLSSSAGLAG